MAAICKQLSRPMGAPRLPQASPEPTIASCLDAYLPIYTFSTSFSVEKASKLARVDSFPVIPDFNESTCESPTVLGGVPSCCRADDGFNGLPIDIYGRVQLRQASHNAAAATAFFTQPFDMPTTNGCNVACMASLASLELSALPSAAEDSSKAQQPSQAAAGRTQIRRHPSDVVLSRRGQGDFATDSISLSAYECGDDVPEVPNRTLLETALMSLWEDRAYRGLFRYDVTQCPTRVLPGASGFIAQLNEGRATKKRPTELTLDRVLQPFDPAKFNFKKAAVSEALVAFLPDDEGNDDGAFDGDCSAPQVLQPVAPLGAKATTAPDGAVSRGDSPNLVLINVSPIDYGHVLLVPRVLENLPQALSGQTVLLALQFARELGNPHFRVGYNSLGAYATINHLHFQSYYLAKAMPCEMATTVPLPGELAELPVPGTASIAATALLAPLRKRPYGDAVGRSAAAAAAVRISRLKEYPVNAFVIEAASTSEETAAAALKAVAAVLGTAAERLQAVNQPFNLLISDAGRRVFLFPQCFAERQAAGSIPAELLDTGVNPAAFEIAGHLVLKRAQDYDGVTEHVAGRLLAQASLPEDRFMAVARLCFGLGGGSGGDDDVGRVW